MEPPAERSAHLFIEKKNKKTVGIQTRAFKFRIYPTKQQEKHLLYHIHLSKELWNSLLAKNKEKYWEEDRFLSKSEMQLMIKKSDLYSQTAQVLSHRLHNAIRKKTDAKKQGITCGFPRFKSFDRMKSLNYPQFGFFLGQKLKVTPFGEICIVKHRQMEGRIKTLTLKRESSGKWFAIFCAEKEKQAPEQHTGPAVGLDLGLTNFAALSDGTMVKNPHHFGKWAKKLGVAQRRLSAKKKGGKNRLRAKLKVAKLSEKVANSRLDFLQKTAKKLLSSYSFIALEKLRIQDMAQQKYGKWINDASWGMFTNILGYKAEEAGCQLVFVDPKNTTKECSACGTLVEKTLQQRQHVCPNCGLKIDRDTNASINILNRATAGIAGRNACGDGEKRTPSLKQEAQAFGQGVIH